MTRVTSDGTRQRSPGCPAPAGWDLRQQQLLPAFGINTCNAFCHLSTLKHLSVIISKKRLMQGQYSSLLEDPSTPFAQTRSRQPFKAWGADTGLKRNLLSARSSSVCMRRVLLRSLRHLEMTFMPVRGCLFWKQKGKEIAAETA